MRPLTVIVYEVRKRKKKGGTAESWQSDRTLWLCHMFISRNGLGPADKDLLVWGGEWPRNFAYSLLCRLHTTGSWAAEWSWEMIGSLLGSLWWHPTSGRRRLGELRLKNTTNFIIQSLTQHLKNLGWPSPFFCQHILPTYSHSSSFTLCGVLGVNFNLISFTCV